MLIIAAGGGRHEVIGFHSAPGNPTLPGKNDLWEGKTSRGPSVGVMETAEHRRRTD